MTGTIKTILADKKFGFIAVEDRPKDLFFHKDKVVGVEFDDLKVGDVVNFDLEDPEGPKGPAAVNVTRA
ncbi:MAG TPA: cold shock domain-containing protein [Candidatus Paceibacterota bacterium]